MSSVDFLLEAFARTAEREAMVWNKRPYTYGWLAARFEHWKGSLAANGIVAGQVVVLEADLSPNAVTLLLALAAAECIAVPLTPAVQEKKSEFMEIAGGEVGIALDAQDEVSMRRLGYRASSEHYERLRRLGHPGLLIFSSGSTGKSKASVHDFNLLLEKFHKPRKAWRMIAFLLFDHIGGVNTVLQTLSSGGCLIAIQNRSPQTVLEAVEEWKAEVLPVTPTFMNLILLSEAYRRHDLSSLQVVSYGTEPMLESTLSRFRAALPHAQLAQLYGLSETGILPSKSRDSDSRWVKIGGHGIATRVVDGMLQIKSGSSMLGYLNAPSPFTEDGWFMTGDSVEVDGEYMKILGRKSDLINVGGEKVYPSEVENVIQEMDNVAEVSVYGERNPITGNIVCARVRPKSAEHESDFVPRLKAFCRERLQSYKVPVKVVVVEEKQHSEGFKKTRPVQWADRLA
ncbi:MAG: ANL family adenylate-forming protein [Candidatus Acidiferrales bacterium]